MPYAKLNEEGRIVMWSREKLDGLDVEFSNGEYIDANCVDGIDDFVIVDGEAVYRPLPEKEAARLEDELGKDDYIASKFVRALVKCDNIADVFSLFVAFRKEYGDRFDANDEKAERINELEEVI